MADAKPMAPFTPGPLHITREVDNEGECQHTVRAATGSPVAVLSNYNAHEQFANATLYAASPKMLKALQDLLKLTEGYEEQIDSEWGDCRSVERIEKDGDLAEEILAARAAIAMATGSAS